MCVSGQCADSCFPLRMPCSNLYVVSTSLPDADGYEFHATRAVTETCKGPWQHRGGKNETSGRGGLSARQGFRKTRGDLGLKVPLALTQGREVRKAASFFCLSFVTPQKMVIKSWLPYILGQSGE